MTWLGACSDGRTSHSLHWTPKVWNTVGKKIDRLTYRDGTRVEVGWEHGEERNWVHQSSWQTQNKYSLWPFVSAKYRVGNGNPVSLPGISDEQRSLLGYSPWGHKELDMTEWLSTLTCTGAELIDTKWMTKNWCFWTVVLEKTLESRLDCKVIQPVHPKGDQSCVFIGRTDAEAETPVLWSPHGKSWLIGKDPDAGRDWGQEEKGTTEDEMVGWHHWLDGHEFE